MEQARTSASVVSADVREIWEGALGIIRAQLNTPTFKTWFEHAEPLGLDGDELIVGASNSWGRDWLESRYTPLLASSLTRAAERPMSVRFVVMSDARSDVDRGAGGASALTAVPVHTTQPAEPVVIPNMEAVESQRVKEASQGEFNQRYTFDSFVMGSSNRFAHAAALAVAETPGSAYNPLFIYGGVGLGKTHLLQAIGHYVRAHYPHLKVTYVSTEQLVNDFIESVQQKGRMEGFRHRYRTNGVLLVDDIQFLIGKKESQDEFFHMFNTLYEAGKQIVLSSDRPPKDLRPLEDRLVSRFEMGLITDIQPPELETRIAILRKKVEAGGTPIPDEVLAFVADRISSNIRELEGALIRIIAYSSLTRHVIDLDLAQGVLKDIFPERTLRPISVASIQQEVSRFYGIPTVELVGAKRSQNIVYPRQIAMYLSRELTDLSLPRIGAEFGGRDHTTVIHAQAKIQKLLSQQREVYNQVQSLTNLIRQKA
jgi:chromosomal replication initiator protein